MKREKIRKIIAAGLAAVSAFMLAGCAEQSDMTGKKEESLPVIIVGCDNYPPFSYVDTDGNQTGIDIELAKEAFHRMGYKPEFELINWENKKELLETGEIDCIWSSFSIDGREEEYQWAGPYMKSRQVIAVRKNSAIYSLEDLAGRTIAVQSTTKPEDIFRKHEDIRIPKVGKILSVEKRELIYTFLSKGYVDAVAAHSTAVDQFMKDYNIEYRILSEPLLEVGLGVAFDKNDDRGLSRELTEIFVEMRQDGTLEQILGKYLTDAEDYLEVDADET